MTLSELIAPAVVSAVVTVVLAPLLFFLLKSREEGRRRQFEVRYVEYKKCLQALEQIAAVARIDFKQAYTGIAASALKEALAEADEDYGPRLQKGLDELSGRLRDSFAGAAGELHGLGLACSAELLTTVNEFVKLQRELVEESIAVISDASISNLGASATEAMKEKARRAESLFERILEQMRAELDVAGPAAGR